MFDVKKVFDSNHSCFSLEAGTPTSSKVFRKKYIDPAFERNHNEGFEIESAYGKVIVDYQRDSFIVGFKAAVQLMLDCIPTKATKE